jgi:hypothetical protein
MDHIANGTQERVARLIASVGVGSAARPLMMDQTACGQLLQLPDALLLHVASFLLRPDRLAVRATCKPLRALLSSAVTTLAVNGPDTAQALAQGGVFPNCRAAMLSFMLRPQLLPHDKRSVLRALAASGALQRLTSVHVALVDDDAGAAAVGPAARSMGPATLEPQLLLELVMALPHGTHLWLQASTCVRVHVRAGALCMCVCVWGGVLH